MRHADHVEQRGQSTTRCAWRERLPRRSGFRRRGMPRTQRN
jgi:hypothetical protein